MPYSFQETLDGLEEADDPNVANEAPLYVPYGALAPPFALHSALTAGSHYLWDRAEDWVPEAEPEPEPPLPSPRAAPNLGPTAIFEELGLSHLNTADDLNRARRKFMWENHPDRRGDISLEIAHQRVATANMLLDRALAHLARRKC